MQLPLGECLARGRLPTRDRDHCRSGAGVDRLRRGWRSVFLSEKVREKTTGPRCFQFKTERLSNALEDTKRIRKSHRK